MPLATITEEEGTGSDVDDIRVNNNSNSSNNMKAAVRRDHSPQLGAHTTKHVITLMFDPGVENPHHKARL